MDWIIIVHLLEGDHFPRWDKVTAECQLWGKPQSTDALNLRRNVHSPIWNHEFKWQLSRKSLVKLKTDRIPVKVTFTGIGEGGSKGTIGYVVLSLRDGNPDGKQQWHTLLNPTKYPAPVVKIEFKICKVKQLEEQQEIEKKRKSTLKSKQPPDIPIEVVSKTKEPKKKDSSSEEEEDSEEEEEGSDEFESESESDKENKKDEKGNNQPEKKSEPAKPTQQPEQPKQPPKKPQKEESSSSEEEEDSESSEEEEDSDEEESAEPKKQPPKKESQKQVPKPQPEKSVVPTTPHRVTVTRTMPTQHQLPPEEPQPPPEPERHYKFSVDLVSVREFEFSAGNLYCQYNYPLFGSDTPVYTTPTIEVYSLNDIPEEERHNFDKNMEFALPGSFCMFEFALAKSILQKVFDETPMIVEVMDKARSAYDKRIGVAAVKLDEVLHAPKSPIYSGTLQVHDSWIPVVAIDDASVRVGLVRVKICLQDLGELPTNTNSQQNLNASTIKRSDLSTKNPLDDWNFEEQKKEMMLKLKQKMKRKEQKMEKELQLKLQAQEDAIMRKHQECMRLEERLRSLLVTTESREKKVLAAEEELRKRRVALQFEYEAKLTQLDDATKRVKTELEHQDHINKMKVEELERQKKNVEKRLKESEQRYKELEDELHAQRQKQAQGPDAKLQAECLALTIQKAELEKAVEKESRKKKELKGKLRQTQLQVEKMQKEYAQEQQERLKKEQHDLEAMRFRFMSKEHDLGQTDRQQLEALKMELQKQKQEDKAAPIFTQIPKPVFIPAPSADLNFNQTATMSSRALPSNLTVDTAKLERLITEREDLLATGMYKPTDRIIKQLDEEIEITQNPQKPRKKIT